MNTRGLDAFLSGEVVSSALEGLANDVLADAGRFVPVETGHLQASGFVDVEPGRARVGYDADYAAFVELGTGRAPAQPYLRPAALRNRGRLR